MKAPTTYLADRAMAKQEPAAEGLKVWRDAAQEQISEAVVDACLLSRPSSYSAGLAARQFGFLGVLAKNKAQKAMAGGLPQHFVLAVTADEVVVLERRLGGRDPVGKPGPEVTRWKRATLDVAWKEAGYLYSVTVVAPEEPDAIQCSVGKSPLAESFLQLLRDPARTTPAA